MSLVPVKKKKKNYCNELCKKSFSQVKYIGMEEDWHIKEDLELESTCSDKL